MPKQLDAKEQRFLEEYLLDLNVERAAVAAGYSQSMAKSKAYQWVSDGKAKPHLFAAIKGAMEKRASKVGVSAEMVVKEFARLAFSDMRNVMDWGPTGVTLKPSDGLSEDAAACVAEVSQTTSLTGGSLKLKVHDKKGALDSLARHLGMFLDKHEHTGAGGQPLVPAPSLTDTARALAWLLSAGAHEMDKGKPE